MLLPFSSVHCTSPAAQFWQMEFVGSTHAVPAGQHEFPQAISPVAAEQQSPELSHDPSQHEPLHTVALTPPQQTPFATGPRQQAPLTHVPEQHSFPHSGVEHSGVRDEICVSNSQVGEPIPVAKSKPGPATYGLPNKLC